MAQGPRFEQQRGEYVEIGFTSEWQAFLAGAGKFDLP
jgi:hypothetical protein